ncbi:MAG: hypothetical protein QXE31_04420 [Candidatus Woesearchaeota archaeon]
MSEATDWSIREMGELLLRVIIVLALIAVFLSVGKILNKSKAVENEINDLNRLISEIEDLQKNEEINIPILGNDYNINIVSMKKALELNLNCNLDKGKYCACVKKKDVILGCKEIKKDVEILTKDINVKSNYLKLSYKDGISIT